jgi:predicted MFS family arabinose efflux permease
MREAVQHLAAPRPPDHRRRLDAVGLAVAAIVVAVVVALGVSVASLIDRYVGWATIGIAIGVVSLLFVVGLLRLALADRRESG